jgi:hypothetical protein
LRHGVRRLEPGFAAVPNTGGPSPGRHSGVELSPGSAEQPLEEQPDAVPHAAEEAAFADRFERGQRRLHDGLDGRYQMRSRHVDHRGCPDSTQKCPKYPGQFKLSRPGATDKIVGREDAAKWVIKNLNDLWAS